MKKIKIKIDIITDNKLIIPEYIINLKINQKNIRISWIFWEIKNLDQQKKRMGI